VAGRFWHLGDRVARGNSGGSCGRHCSERSRGQASWRGGLTYGIIRLLARPRNGRVGAFKAV